MSTKYIVNNASGQTINGVPVSTNIYNSDGTLNGNRTLSGASNNLNFADLNVFKTTSGGQDIGLKLDFENGDFWIGDEVNNGNVIWIDDTNQEVTLATNTNGSSTQLTLDGNSSTIYGSYNTIQQGLKLDFANNIYQLGQITFGNTKNFTINDAEDFGFQFNGTGTTQNTSGVASGKFLKIKVDGVDYVIELKNPS